MFHKKNAVLTDFKKKKVFNSTVCFLPSSIQLFTYGTHSRQVIAIADNFHTYYGTETLRQTLLPTNFMH